MTRGRIVYQLCVGRQRDIQRIVCQLCVGRHRDIQTLDDEFHMFFFQTATVFCTASLRPWQSIQGMLGVFLLLTSAEF